MTDSQNSSSNPPGSAQDSLPASDLWATQAGAAAAPSSPGITPKAAPTTEPGWERAVLEKLALAALTEQRAARRWKIFFRFAWLLLVLAIFGGAMMQAAPSANKSAPHTAVVDIKGEIAELTPASVTLITNR